MKCCCEIENVKVVAQGLRNREEGHIKTDLKLEELKDWFTHLQIHLGCHTVTPTHTYNAK